MDELTADEAFERLRAGNARFLSDTVEAPRRDADRRRLLAERQHPFAVVLCCADSRVVPEIAFDTGIGELFVVRVAGNVANRSTVASIEYAIANLGPKLVVVMGHQNCGAVAAAVAGGSASPSLDYLLEYIRPAVRSSDDPDPDAVARRNTQVAAEQLLTASDIIRAAVHDDGVRIITAFYHPGTGRIELV